MRLTLLRAIAASLLVVSTVAAVPAHAASAPRWVLGYYVGYLRGAMPPAQITWSAMTHLVVGPVTPRADATLDTSLDLGARQGPALGKQLASAATAHGVTPMLMIGGAGAHDGFLGAASQHRVAFENHLLALMDNWGYQGLDLDWEPVNDSDQAILLRLAQDLRARRPGIVLTVPVGWIDPNYQTVPPFYAQLASTVDRVDVMTYGMAGAWDGWRSWHSSSLHGEAPATPSSVDTSVAAYEDAGVPAAQLGVGVGFYGSCWTAPVTGPNQQLRGSTVTADDNTMSYTNIMKSYYVATNYHYGTVAQAPYLSFTTPHGPAGCTFVSYENARSVTAKGQWAQAQGLGAVIVWNVNEGHDTAAAAGHRDALLQTVRSAFGA